MAGGDVFFSSRRRHTRCALVTGVQTCALPISRLDPCVDEPHVDARADLGREGQLNLGRRDAGAFGAERPLGALDDQIGRASCRESVCQYVSISVVAVTLKKQQILKYTYLSPNRIHKPYQHILVTAVKKE